MKRLAIDFGTTTTLVARTINKDTAIQQIQGKRNTPTVFRYSSESNNTRIEAFGSKAWETVYQYPETTIWEFKPYLGKSKVFGDLDADAATRLYLERIAAELKDIYGGIPVNESFGETIVGYPADWTQARQKLLCDILSDIGYPDVKGKTEPEAVADSIIAKKITKLDPHRCFCVVDFGGGTLDITILRKDKSKYETLTADGDADLGGRHFDTALMNHFCQQKDIDLEQMSVADRASLAKFCRILKEDLSANNDSISTVPTVECMNHQSWPLFMNRDDFQICCSDLIDRFEKAIQLVINRSNISSADISHVILAGGSSNMFFVRDKVKAMLPNSHIVPLTAPDECICEGLLAPSQAIGMHKPVSVGGDSVEAGYVAEYSDKWDWGVLIAPVLISAILPINALFILALLMFGGTFVLSAIQNNYNFIPQTGTRMMKYHGATMWAVFFVYLFLRMLNLMAFHSKEFGKFSIKMYAMGIIIYNTIILKDRLVRFFGK